MSKDLNWLIETVPNPNIPVISPGDTVKTSVRIHEGDKTRTQIFEGIVIRVRKGGSNSSFTVRHISYNIGVERTFFFNSPLVEKVEITSQAKVRRAKLYYLRGLSPKATRAKLKTKTKTA